MERGTKEVQEKMKADDAIDAIRAKVRAEFLTALNDMIVEHKVNVNEKT